MALADKCNKCSRYSKTCGGLHILQLDVSEVEPIEIPKQLQSAIDDALKLARDNQFAFRVTNGEWTIEYKSEFYKNNVEPFKKGCEK